MAGLRRWMLRGAGMLVAVLGVVLCAEFAQADEKSKPAGLEPTVRQALREAAQLKGAPDSAAVERLTGLYRQLLEDDQQPIARRDALRLAMRSRLQRWGAALRQPALRQAALAPILAQRLPPAGAGQGGAAQQSADYGQELADLIEETIAPASWEGKGGNGVIRFWHPAHALVVRQTGDVHEDLASLLKDLGL